MNFKPIIIIVFIAFLIFTNSQSQEEEPYVEPQTENQVLRTKMDAIKASPKDAKKWLDLGNFLASLDRHGEAIKAYERNVLRASHYRYQARYYTAKSAFISGDKKKAWNIFKRLTRDNKTPARVKVATDYLVRKYWPSPKENFKSDNLPTVYKFSPFFSSLTYDAQTTKTEGEAIGFYISRYNFKSMWEVELDRSSIIFDSNSSIESYSQFDVSIAYSIFKEFRYQYRGGLHLIIPSDESINGGFTAFSGVKKHLFEKGRFTLNGYFTKLSNSTSSSMALQLSPMINYFENRLHFNMGGHLIRTSGVEESVGYSTNGFQISGEIEVSYDFGDIIPAFGIFAGDQIHFVKSDGFIVNNLPDLHTFGIHLSVEYKFTKTSHIKFLLSQGGFQSFNETETAEVVSLNGQLKFTF